MRYRTSDAYSSELRAQFDDWHAACLVAGMPPLFTSKRGWLGSAQASFAPALDLVELWKTRVLEALARSTELRQSAWSIIAWAGIGVRDCNRNPEAQELLQVARRLGQYSTETSKLLIDVLFAQGDRAGASAVIEADAGLLSAHDRQLALLALDSSRVPRS